MKKYLASLLVLLFVLSPATVFAADSFTLNLSAKEVRRGGELTLSGTVPGEANGDVIVKIVSPAQTVFYIDVLSPVNGNYSATVAIPGSEDLAPLGRYTVIAGSGDASQTQTFSIVGQGGSTPGNGGGSDDDDDNDDDSEQENDGSNIPAPTAPTDGTGIPAGAGLANGSTIAPELAQDGRYIIGSDVLANAAQQASGAVTIELPASAAESGAALEFPAKSVSELESKNLDLVITSGNRTVRFPAGSLAVSGDELARIRIVLNAAWSDEAKTLVAQSLQGNADYKTTGVVLSVVIQVINGDSVTEIHELDKPAVVTLELTEEQQKLLSADLAGVYYVDGQGAEYVPGTLNNGTFTFTAEHFSYYAILEYNKTFVDLAGHWAENAVKALAAKHIVTGVDERHYEPNRGITRAEFVTLIMRAVEQAGNASDIAAAPSGTAANPFKDVAPGQYYTQQVADAAALGIVNGYGGAFRPNERITREEAVVALIRAVEYSGESGSGGQGTPAFADAKEISAWAAAAVNEAWSQGLIQGDGMRFNPHHSVTRAEVAVMIQRMLADRS